MTRGTTARYNAALYYVDKSDVSTFRLKLENGYAKQDEVPAYASYRSVPEKFDLKHNLLNAYITFKQRGIVITKSMDDENIVLNEDCNKLEFVLTQLETLGFYPGTVDVQIRGVIKDGGPHPIPVDPIDQKIEDALEEEFSDENDLTNEEVDELFGDMSEPEQEMLRSMLSTLGDGTYTDGEFVYDTVLFATDIVQVKVKSVLQEGVIV